MLAEFDYYEFFSDKGRLAIVMALVVSIVSVSIIAYWQLAAKRMECDLKERLAKARLGNVVPVTTKKQQQGIGSESLDGVLLPFNLHNAADKEAFLQEFLPFLKRGAWIAVLEWQKHGTNGGPPESQRLEETQVIAMAERAGLRVTGRRTLTPEHYLVLLRK